MLGLALQKLQWFVRWGFWINKHGNSARSSEARGSSIRGMCLENYQRRNGNFGQVSKCNCSWLASYSLWRHSRPVLWSTQAFRSWRTTRQDKLPFPRRLCRSRLLLDGVCPLLMGSEGKFFFQFDMFLTLLLENAQPEFTLIARKSRVPPLDRIFHLQNRMPN